LACGSGVHARRFAGRRIKSVRMVFGELWTLGDRGVGCRLKSQDKKVSTCGHASAGVKRQKRGRNGRQRAFNRFRVDVVELSCVAVGCLLGRNRFRFLQEVVLGERRQWHHPVTVGPSDRSDHLASAGFRLSRRGKERLLSNADNLNSRGERQAASDERRCSPLFGMTGQTVFVGWCFLRGRNWEALPKRPR